MYGSVCYTLLHFSKIAFFKSADLYVSYMLLCKRIQFNIVFLSLLWISGLIFVCYRQNFNRTNSPGFQKKVQFGNENTKLELRKVPPELNNISKLNEHFSKFGNLVNLQVRGNKEKPVCFDLIIEVAAKRRMPVVFSDSLKLFSLFF